MPPYYTSATNTTNTATELVCGDTGISRAFEEKGEELLEQYGI